MILQDYFQVADLNEVREGAYNVVPVPATELRQRLLAKVGLGGNNDPASRCLNLIDELRDEYGAPEAEPRHPDIATGRPFLSFVSCRQIVRPMQRPTAPG